LTTVASSPTTNDPMIAAKRLRRFVLSIALATLSDHTPRLDQFGKATD
jgi:hypothetical protein